jgi:hypothetical protein
MLPLSTEASTRTVIRLSAAGWANRLWRESALQDHRQRLAGDDMSRLQGQGAQGVVLGPRLDIDTEVDGGETGFGRDHPWRQLQRPLQAALGVGGPIQVGVGLAQLQLQGGVAGIERRRAFQGAQLQLDGRVGPLGGRAQAGRRGVARRTGQGHGRRRHRLGGPVGGDQHASQGVPQRRHRRLRLAQRPLGIDLRTIWRFCRHVAQNALDRLRISVPPAVDAPPPTRPVRTLTTSCCRLMRGP